MIIPPINTKGTFVFGQPFDTLVNGAQVFTVTAVRNLVELEKSGEKPYETIYTSIGLTETDFVNDLNNDIPIVVFVTDGNEFFYVPANRVLSQPLNDGVIYQEKSLVLPLGNLPKDYNLDVLLTAVHDTVRDTLGVNTTPTVIPTSADVQYTVDQDIQFRALLDNSKLIKKTYATLYKEQLVINAKQTQLIDNFNIMFRNNVCAQL